MGLFGNKQIVSTDLLKSTMYNRVTYAGMEQGDLMVALANVALAAGLKVAILDNSYTHDIWEMVQNSPAEMVVDKGNLCVVKDAVLTPDNHGWDLVIEYLGANVPADYVSPNQMQVLVTDSRQPNINALKAMLSDNSDQCAKMVCEKVEVLVRLDSVKENQIQYRNQEWSEELVHKIQRHAHLYIQSEVPSL